MAAQKLGQLLVEKGLITEGQLQEALKEQKKDKAFLGAIVAAKGWASEEDVAKVLAEQQDMPFARLGELQMDPALVSHVPLKIAMHFQVVPVHLEGNVLTLAVANPQSARLADELSLALEQKYVVKLLLTTDRDIGMALKKFYGLGADTVGQILADKEPEKGPKRKTPEQEGVQDIQQLAADASVMKLVNQLLLEGYQRRASDIHLEPARGKVRVRYRVDGLLHDIEVPEAIRELFPAIVSRVKVISNLNLVERRLPQDGRAQVKVGGEKLDLRISVLPTPVGESVVIRILPNKMLLDVKGLGFARADQRALESMLCKPHGLIFVTGPTGSGKTTTLYAALGTIRRDQRKIITLEDPVEYEIDGITQVQVNPRIGFSFAEGLRSLLRHDPDVMMVGEVRDLETAELAIQVALTGHLVLSTLHTNNASTGVTRLVDMGIEPFLIVSSVECFIAQRLVRVLCENCKQETPSEWKDTPKIYRAVGCETCQGTGFSGRTSIYEMLPLTSGIRELILKGASADAIQEKAIELGMKTLREDGWEKVKAGLTTPDEVLRVTEMEQ